MSTINLYDLGDLIRCSGAFQTAAGTANDPGAVTFKVKQPSGDITTYVYGSDAGGGKGATGQYHVDVLTTAAGRWHYRFEGTVSGQAAAEHEFHVQPSRFE